MTIIANFRDTPLSNFSPDGFIIAGDAYSTSEHWYQCMKTINIQHREMIRSADSPGKAKRLGGRHGIIELRADWDAVRIPVMRRGLEAKFNLNTVPGEYLLSTRDALLVEENTWGDRFWGRCDGVGENWLGHLLMARRAELRAAVTL